MSNPMLITEKMYMDFAGIYWIRNLINAHIYIGSAINLRTRRNRHFSLLSLNKHYNIHLQRAYNKYGKENFIFEMLINCHPNMIYWYEQQFLDQLKPEYNSRKDVTHNTGIKLSDETKRKIGEKFKGRKLSKDHINKRTLSYLLHRYELDPMMGINWRTNKTTSDSYIVNFRQKYIGCYKILGEAQTVYKNLLFNYIQEHGG